VIYPFAGCCAESPFVGKNKAGYFPLFSFTSKLSASLLPIITMPICIVAIDSFAIALHSHVNRLLFVEISGARLSRTSD